MNTNWYVLHSKPHKELFLAGELIARNFEAFCPVLYIKPVNPRSRKIKPYFPGYLFVNLDLQNTNLSSLSWIPGSIGLVTIGTEPAPVPDELINAIRKKIDAISAAGNKVFDAKDVAQGLRAGDKVLVEDGPFAGYQGIFDSRLPGSDRVRILLDLLKQRQMRLDLSASLIKRIDETKR
jgi:transcriptional antiterminator RfaH